MARVPRVLVTVPTTGWVHKTVAACLLRLWATADPHQLTILFPTHRPYENNLHHIVRDLLAGPWDFWLSIDADNPPTRNPLELCALDLDVVGLPTPVWHYVGTPGERPIYWNAYRYVPEADAYTEHPTHDGLQEVDAIGTGAFLAARRVFEHPAMQQAPFQRGYHPDGRVERGNDLAFSERAKLAGFRLWAHYDYPCDHLCELGLLEVITAHQRAKVTPS